MKPNVLTDTLGFVLFVALAYGGFATGMWYRTWRERRWCEKRMQFPD